MGRQGPFLVERRHAQPALFVVAFARAADEAASWQGRALRIRVDALRAVRGPALEEPLRALQEGARPAAAAAQPLTTVQTSSEGSHAHQRIRALALPPDLPVSGHVVTLADPWSPVWGAWGPTSPWAS
jgi:hypothetical protein